MRNNPIYPNSLAAFTPRHVPTGDNSNNSLGNFLRSRERMLWSKGRPYVRAKQGPLS